MKFAALIWRNALRNKRRSILTVFSLAASLFLLTTLRTVLFELQGVSVAPQSALRLVTRHAVSFTNPLPIAYLERIKRVRGVREVIPGNWFGGIYIDEKNFFGQFTVDQDKAFEIFPELQMPEDQKEAFRKLRNGAIAGARLFERFGWKIGQRITLREVIASRVLARRFAMEIGQPLKLEGGDPWVVVGLFDAGGSAYDSEIWTDVNAVADEFKRPVYSSTLMRAKDSDAVAALAQRISDDRRLHLQARPEREYFREQTKASAPIKVLGTFIALIMSIGACFAAMNAMYASVAYRKREIGTLRVLGFQRSEVLVAFLIESVLLAIAGGALGCVLSIPIHGVSTGTMNFNTFAELAFYFRITTGMLAAGIAFSALMGAFGGFLPALFAARSTIIQSLRD